MTVGEFSNEFDILYDNVAAKSSPGLDLYEKSIFLTKAQLEIVKTHYSISNKYNKGFEASEKRRVDLKELIRDYKTNSILNTGNNISNTSKFFELPNDIFLIIQEQATINSTLDNCISDKIVNVVPKTHDEYNIQIKNPFKKPDSNLVWRMDYSSQDSLQSAELISIHEITNYHIRYIKYPNPIILTDINSGDFVGENLRIEGLANAQTSELHESIHSEILNRAVEIAIRDYKESSLQSKVQLNLRNE
jgi:hypothetical protein